MSERGLASRREAEEWIARGWIRVNGTLVDHPSFKALDDCVIELSPQCQKIQSELVTIILHKPVGYVSSQAEDGYTPAIRLITPENQAKQGPQKRLEQDHLKGLAVAGRLDIDSRGLLVFTQQGTLAKQLIGENSEIEKEYVVLTSQNISRAQVEKLSGPIHLDGKFLKKAIIEKIGPNKLRFVLKEGKKRQVRRMAELAGLQVTSLIRVRIGKIKLGTLPQGQWRFLQPDEHF